MRSNKYTSSTSRQGAALGLMVSAAVMATIVVSKSNPGDVAPARLETQSFSVAMLQGPKQTAQEAPDNVAEVADSVIAVPTTTPAPVVAAQRDTSLPSAVKAAQTSSAAKVTTKPVEVLPPAKVSMPGGKLKVEDTPLGDGVDDPFAMKPRQVFIRLLLNTEGKAIDARIVRGGGEPMRDAVILRAMASRSYSTEKLLRIADKNGQPLWQFDMVVDYGTNDFLP